ncbi:MAG: hypothetical protein IJ975_03055, partial [Clostridia bacterium]|nr:hypothetical protein [Clostridia bacterium]
MSYQALYRKYRPKTFDGIIGQNNITSTLANQIAAGKIVHAYLFCGSRGTGKTSTAKIFARAINCQNENDVGGRFFKRFQKGVIGAVSQHMHFINDINFILAASWHKFDVFAK